MSIFHFKQFSLSDEKSTLKIGTDAVLLGAWIPLSSTTYILDIGCGCGIISLITAQRCNAQIIGIDIDLDSIEEAKQNAILSPWNSRLEFLHYSLQNFNQISEKEIFDCIVCNPPFFEHSLKSPSVKKNLSKHNDHLSFEELSNCAYQLLSKNGIFSVILPVNTGERFEKICKKIGFYPSKCCYIKSFPYKKPHRVMYC